MVSLGSVGRNVAAGMTGGLGYFYDEEGERAAFARCLSTLCVLCCMQHGCFDAQGQQGAG